MTKAALLVISLLFAGAAVAAGFTIGTPGVIAFSIASGVFLSAFAISICRSPREQQELDCTEIVRSLEDLKKVQQDAFYALEIKCLEPKYQIDSELLKILLEKNFIDQQKQ